MLFDHPLTESVLEAFDGVVYVTHPDGVILHIPERNWHQFAKKNRAVRLDHRSFLGHSLFDVVVGDAPRDLYNKLHRSVVEQRAPEVTFSYRCDSPHMRREMRMSISPIMREGAVAAVLYQSITLREMARPPIDLFLSSNQPGVAPVVPPRPILPICSFCHDVRVPALDGRGEEWVVPETYYTRGGTSEVILSHEICPGCRVRVRAA